MDLNDELLREAKKRAADEQVPLRDIVEAALRQYLSGKVRKGRYRLRWRADKGGGLKPGVDLSNRSALLDLLDGIE